MEQKPIIDRNAKEINEAGKIARFYGFQPIDAPEVEKRDFDSIKEFGTSSQLAEKAALLRMYFEEKMAGLQQPAMFYCDRPFHGTKEKKKPNRLESSIISIGSPKSVCECISILAALSILKSIGYKNLVVEVNSIGDKESMSEFQKKLNVFVRKNINSFPAELRQTLKKDIFAIFNAETQGCDNPNAECPRSIEFLSEPSRLHFKEILEFLEVLDTPYNINNKLVGDFNIGSETVFSIKSDDEELASGFRFNRLAKKIGCKKDIPATVLNISAKLKKPLKKVRARVVEPKFYLIQFGPEAKLKSFLILEELFKAGASVIHSIAKDKLGGQIGVAEAMNIPYIILIGQKEALENSVVIRNTTTRSQEIVPIPELADRIKKL